MIFIIKNCMAADKLSVGCMWGYMVKSLLAVWTFIKKTFTEMLWRRISQTLSTVIKRYLSGGKSLAPIRPIHSLYADDVST